MLPALQGERIPWPSNQAKAFIKRIQQAPASASLYFVSFGSGWVSFLPFEILFLTLRNLREVRAAVVAARYAV